MPFEPNLDAIIAYAQHARSINSEAGRVAHFCSLLKEVFGDSPTTVEDFTGSMERGITYALGKGATVVRRGRVDAILGSAILEFKKDIKQGRETAKAELKKYAAGLTNAAKLDDVPYVGIISDGVVFERYDLSLETGKRLTPENISIERSDVFELKPTRESALSFFWFIHRNLLQDGKREPTVEAFEREFGPLGPAFYRARRALNAAWEKVKADTEVQTARGQWAKYLQFAYGSQVDEGPQGDSLYLRHTYLACLAKFMVWAAFKPGATERDDTDLIQDVISGVEARKLGVMGATDRDPFHWVLRKAAAAELQNMWVRLLGELRAYRLKDLKADVLKVLYEALVDPVERHDLGEYYTPDWLCQFVVDEMLPRDSDSSVLPSVLDPTCGSGSFIVAVVRRYRELLEDQNLPPENRAGTISVNVVGFDIHPLAVLVARANYMLALGDDLKNSRCDVEIPIFLADTMTDVEGEDAERPGLGFERGVTLQIGEPPLEKVVFPELPKGFSFGYDEFITAAAKLADALEKGTELSEKSLKLSLKNRFPAFGQIEARQFEAAVKAVVQLGSQMAKLSAEKRNTIWAFVARNFYRPYLYRRTFDIVVGNPPWLSFRYVTNAAYKRRLEILAIERYGVCSDKASLRTQTELATTFLMHACAIYLKRKGRIAFVLPRSVFSGDQHAKLRAGPNRGGASYFRIEKAWDLAEVVPLFNVPSCVLFCATKPREIGGQPSFSGEVISGRLSQREPLLREASDKLKRTKTRFHRVNLGGRTAWSTEAAGAGKVTAGSWYADKFFQGATIVPRNAFFVQYAGDLPASPMRTVSIETDREQAKTAKAPWKSLIFKGQVERRFLFTSALAKHVLPFALDGELPTVVLPLMLEGGKRKLQSPKLLTSAEIREEGYFDAAEYFDKVEKSYAKHRKGAASEQTTTVNERLDYSKGLTGHEFGKKFIVLYTAEGSYTACVLLRRDQTPSTFVTEHVIYRYETNSKNEGLYLTTVLNSPNLMETIRPFLARGLMGERHIQKKILEVPFPQFDPKNSLHAEIAELGERCTAIAEKQRANLKGKNIGKRRSEMRAILKDELAEADRLVEKLLAKG